MDHRKAVHGLKSHDHSDKVYACPDKSCWRRKKSKGFATLLGLEDHMREKHGNGPIPASHTLPMTTSNGNSNGNSNDNTNANVVDNIGGDADEDMDDDNVGDGSIINASSLLGAFDLTLDPQLQAPLNSMQQHQQQMIGDPITPASSTPEPDQHQHQNQHQAQPPPVEPEPPRRTMSVQERETMKLRVKRLEIEREKLDTEIRRLNMLLSVDAAQEAENMGAG